MMFVPSGDLRQGSSNNFVTNVVLGFPYIFQRETQPSFENLLLVVLVILRQRSVTRFRPKISLFNFSISEQYFRSSIWSARTTVSILYSKDRKNFEDIESKWLFSLNNTGNQWCCLIFSAKFRKKDKQLYKQNNSCCKDSPLKVCQKIVYVWTVFSKYFLTNTDIAETRVSVESL